MVTGTSAPSTVVKVTRNFHSGSENVAEVSLLVSFDYCSRFLRLCQVRNLQRHVHMSTDLCMTQYIPACNV